ncbi:carboxypeptidase regulatory-like domain-containing protein [Natrinema longum]|uniref:Carboxypeptidase regulatory-like domain-containing protein n=1 Tax=Natrinema longum TaxID=370324 RepID=A0A8A2U443_9EURY|nr:carboxypeptidase regulatory-like domain-containing protein [Natrinema longum]MBZ6495040.1 carboxypeptidase regulatory-like domain-containing protein [Natrinema longum]QSW83666.1 carboxypeptidase regulatory-like domain-containing protein [Natrinema longum]
MQITRQLRIDVGRREVDVGTEITVRVRDDRRQPVEGAIVSTETKSTRTDERGLCNLQFGSPGFWKLTAAKSPTDRVAYKPASRLVRVVPNAAALRPYRSIGSR